MQTATTIADLYADLYTDLKALDKANQETAYREAGDDQVAADHGATMGLDDLRTIALRAREAVIWAETIEALIAKASPEVAAEMRDEQMIGGDYVETARQMLRTYREALDAHARGDAAGVALANGETNTYLLGAAQRAVRIYAGLI